MEILQFTTLPPNMMAGLQQVHQAVFDGDTFKEEKLIGKSNLRVFICHIHNKVVGFKMGYEEEPGIFYSWLGGVHPEFQQRGIAQKLMTAQHEALKKLGYKQVYTTSRNNRRAMLLLNIKNGFDVVDTCIDDKGRHKIRLRKHL